MICSNMNRSDINLTTAKSIPFRITFLLIGAICMLLAVIPDTVDARGSGRAAGGGISRSSPASGGSLSSRATAERPAVERPAITRQANPAAQSRTARNAGDIHQPRTASAANGAQSADGAGQARGVGETRSIGQTRAAVAEKPTAAEMAAYRQQFQQQNRDTDRDRDNWDRPVDPDYGVPVTDRPVVPAVVVGGAAGAIAINRADDYVDYVNTVPDPAYLSEDACSLKAMTAVNDVTYYRCSDAWYKRGYQSGEVVYIPSDPPAGF